VTAAPGSGATSGSGSGSDATSGPGSGSRSGAGPGSGSGFRSGPGPGSASGPGAASSSGAASAARTTSGSGTTGALPYRLVATDLDGTLLRTDGTVSQESRDALAAATAAGAAHIIVTGRSVPWTRQILDDLGYDGLAVCGQGGQLYDAGAHQLLTSVTLDRQLAALKAEQATQ